jgi:hypothetical protein
MLPVLTISWQGPAWFKKKGSKRKCADQGSRMGQRMKSLHPLKHRGLSSNPARDMVVCLCLSYVSVVNGVHSALVRINEELLEWKVAAPV